MTDTNALADRLEALAAKATPGNLATAERHTESEFVECPFCQGDGEVEAADYCNFDGKALGVQFYGIGDEFGAHEKLWRKLIDNLPTIIAALRAEHRDCPSCGGLNTSCPEGCERDENGELDGSTLADHPNAEDYFNRAQRAEQALAERDAEVVRLREALNNVLHDKYPRPVGRHWRSDRKPSESDLCEHDTPMWDTCINCFYAYVESALGGNDATE